MKTTITSFTLLLFFALNVSAQEQLSLQQKIESQLQLYKTKGDFPVYYSEGQELAAEFIGELCTGANAYFKSTLAQEEVPFQLLVLSEADWPNFTTPKLIYGMPHYLGDGKTLVVAAEDCMFWRMQVPDPAKINAPFKELIPNVYTLNGQLSGRYFFDLLAVHELGHAWNWTGKINTQRKWMNELFCNIMLHTYIAEERPELLAGLETLPAYWVQADVGELKYTTLKQFEEDYRVLGQENPFNYGWFQFRFHRAAKLLYDEVGAEAMVKLWNFLQKNQDTLSDEELVNRLGKEVHPFLAELVLNW